MNTALLSSKKMDYCTPQDFFDKLDQEFHFALDAAATKKAQSARGTIHRQKTAWKCPGVAGGGGILQSALWTGDRKVGPQGVGRGSKRNNHRFADPGQNRYNIFP